MDLELLDTFVGRLMLRKFLAVFGIGVAAASGAAAGPPYGPYASDSANAIYNLLFCDEPSAFQGHPKSDRAEWQKVLFANPPSASDLSALASDASQEGRVRFLAYSRLRGLGQQVKPKILLGVVVEVPMAGGLDALAAYSEGGVRYINQSGKMVIGEGAANFRPLVQRLFSASESVVARIGPWDKPRIAPPKQGNVRMTFLVSDGMYFGEGPMSVMQRDALAGPVIQQATQLLLSVTKAGVE